MVTNSKFDSENPRGLPAGIFYLRLFVLLFFTSLLARLEAQPKLVVKDSKINYGFVKRGELIKNEYEISNTGNRPLLITEAEIACSCTTVDFPKHPILPGQKATVVVNFNTTTVWGRQDRVVLLHSNDPKGPAKLRYKGVVMDKK